jgi:TIGR03009 family protein
MRRGIRRVLVLAIGATTAVSHGVLAQQEGARPPAADARAKAAAPAAHPAGSVNDARMKILLRDWQQRSEKLKTLDVLIARVDKSPAWGDEEFEGRAILKAPNLAWLDFKKIERDEQKKRLPPVPHERIVCTGTEVWQYRSDTKQIFIFPLDKQNQKRALEEGPLPFLFNMKADEAEARYLMALINETKDYFTISVTPRLKIDQEAFSKAFIKLNRKTFLPDRIFLLSPDGTSSKDFVLSGVQANQPVRAENFKGVVLGKPWQVVRDPGGGADPKPQQGIGNRPPGLTPKGGLPRRQ